MPDQLQELLCTIVCLSCVPDLHDVRLKHVYGPCPNPKLCSAEYKRLCCAVCQATGGEDEGADEGPTEGDVSKERAALMRATSQGGSQAIEVMLLLP